MSAISGMIGLGFSEEVAKAMLGTMKRRGTEEAGKFEDPEAALFQIGCGSNGGLMVCENLIMVFDGEFYNSLELRQELEKMGHEFHDTSDPLLLLRAYEQWGEACLKKINGIFAFAIWDRKNKVLFMARDRIGVKPLFYGQKGEKLVFGSKIGTVLAGGIINPELDQEGAAELILLGPGRMPGSGILRGIRELEPGCFGFFQAGRLRITQYWSLRDREHRESLPETAEHVRYLVEDAVRRQLAADASLGVFLSGGLDSSLITAIAAKKFRQEGEKLPTFSVDYRHNDRYFHPDHFQPDSDGSYITIMEKTFRTNHNRIEIGPEELAEALEEAGEARGFPGMGDVDCSLLLFCHQVSQKVKVCLSGECADEIFGGYPWYREADPEEGFPWAQNSLQRAGLLSPVAADGTDCLEFIRETYRQTLGQTDILPGTSYRDRRVKKMVNLHFRWFMQTLLERNDRMSAGAGIRIRTPFCDYRIAEYLYGVPWDMKETGGREKGLLRLAMAGKLPPEVLYRKKSPYPKIWHPRYREIVLGRLRRVLAEDGPLCHLISPEAAEKAVSGEAPWYGQLMRGPQTAAWLLQLDFWLKANRVQFLF